jgi:ubiquinone/menaquinone biosynthesis C-methylase UbiE
VLEVGCVTGHWLEFLQAGNIQLQGLDFSAGMLAKARLCVPGIPVVRATAESLPWRANSFDHVFCINAFQHFPEKKVFLSEARRLLRPGGKILIVGLDPHRSEDQWFVYDYFPESLGIDRQRYASAGSLRIWMRETGFQNVVTQEVEHWTYQFPMHEILRQGRLDKAATSQLSVLTDAEYQHGMERLRLDIQRAEAKGQTLFLKADFRLYGTSAVAAEVDS